MKNRSENRPTCSYSSRRTSMNAPLTQSTSRKPAATRLLRRHMRAKPRYSAAMEANEGNRSPADCSVPSPWTSLHPQTPNSVAASARRSNAAKASRSSSEMSGFTRSISRPVAAAAPRFAAAANPEFSVLRSSLIQGNCAATISGVPSVEALSMTTTSVPGTRSRRPPSWRSRGTRYVSLFHETTMTERERPPSCIATSPRSARSLLPRGAPSPARAPAPRRTGPRRNRATPTRAAASWSSAPAGAAGDTPAT